MPNKYQLWKNNIYCVHYLVFFRFHLWFQLTCSVSRCKLRYNNGKTIFYCSHGVQGYTGDCGAYITNTRGGVLTLLQQGGLWWEEEVRSCQPFRWHNLNIHPPTVSNRQPQRPANPCVCAMSCTVHVNCHGMWHSQKLFVM